MPKVTENELRMNLKNGKFANLYFIFGKEILLCQYYANLIAKKAIPPELSDFNLTKLNGVDHSVDNISDAVMSMPIMAERRCVLLCDFDIPSLDKKDKDTFMDYITNPYSQTVLILWFNSTELYQRKPDGSLTNNLKGEWKKIVDEAEKKGTVLEVSPATEYDIKKRISDNAVRRGRKIDRDAVEKLYSLVGNDTLLLSNELDKLSAYCSDGIITSRAVNELTSKTVENNIYRIVSSINKHDADVAYSEIQNLLIANISPELIIGTMASEYINAYYVNLLKKLGVNRVQVIKILKISDYQAKKADDLSYRLGEKLLEDILKAFCRADDKIKLRSNLNSKTVIETLVAELLLITSKV